MDRTNPTARTSCPSSGGYLPPILDANTIQAAYLAIQMQNQLQQNQQQAAAIPPLTQLPHNVTSDPERLLAQAALAQAQMSPLVSALQDSTMASSQRPLPPRQTSAFAPIRTIGNPITAIAPSRPQLTPPSTNLDIMLLQMQMAAAAAGLTQAPLNLLQSSSALNLLTPHLRLQTQGTGFDSLPLANHAVLNQLIPNANVASQPNLIAQACGVSNVGAVNETLVRPSHSLPDASYEKNATSTGSLHHCFSLDKRSREPHKRHHSDMSVLRSLCEDTDTPEPSPAAKRRSLQVNNERRMFASEAVMTTKPDGRRWSENVRGFDALRESLKEEEESPQQRSTVAQTTSVLPQPNVPTTDPNSPNRHHPLNHQPPAMEARFLECIAAIALHSNFALPDAQRGKRDDINDTQTIDSNDLSNKDKSGLEADNDTRSKSVVIEERQTDENRSESRDGCKSVEVLEDTYEVTGLDTQKPKKTWPLSAIDEELCKEMESYKGTDVPMIHAYVIPPRSDTSSSSSDACDEHAIQSVPSLAVPVPILNILLERILDTMLQT